MFPVLPADAICKRQRAGFMVINKADRVDESGAPGSRGARKDGEGCSSLVRALRFAIGGFHCLRLAHGHAGLEHGARSVQQCRVGRIAPGLRHMLLHQFVHDVLHDEKPDVKLFPACSFNYDETDCCTAKNINQSFDGYFFCQMTFFCIRWRCSVSFALS